MDIEVRFTLERGTSGFYTYAEYTHTPRYPAAQRGREPLHPGGHEPHLRLALRRQGPQPADDANDDLRNGVVIHAKEQSILTRGIYKNSVEHKYSYNAVMYKLTAWGWSSTKDHIGVYFINPSNEYIGGGAGEARPDRPHGSGTAARLLDLRPLRRRRRQQHPRRRGLEARRRPHLRLLQLRWPTPRTPPRPTWTS